jgi:anti-anti-sigma factor
VTSAADFSVQCRRADDTVHLNVSGELDLGAEPVVVKALSEHLVPHQVSRVAIDVSAVTFIDSSGLRALLRCRDVALRAQAAPTLALGGNESVQKLLEIAGVTDWFDYA